MTRRPVTVRLDGQTRHRARQSALDEWHRRSQAKVAASPQEHAAAVADAVLDELEKAASGDRA